MTAVNLQAQAKRKQYVITVGENSKDIEIIRNRCGDKYIHKFSNYFNKKFHKLFVSERYNFKEQINYEGINKFINEIKTKNDKNKFMKTVQEKNGETKTMLFLHEMNHDEFNMLMGKDCQDNKKTESIKKNPQLESINLDGKEKQQPEEGSEQLKKSEFFTPPQSIQSNNQPFNEENENFSQSIVNCPENFDHSGVLGGSTSFPSNKKNTSPSQSVQNDSEKFNQAGVLKGDTFCPGYKIIANPSQPIPNDSEIFNRPEEKEPSENNLNNNPYTTTHIQINPKKIENYFDIEFNRNKHNPIDLSNYNDIKDFYGIKNIFIPFEKKEGKENEYTTTPKEFSETLESYIANNYYNAIISNAYTYINEYGKYEAEIEKGKNFNGMTAKTVEAFSKAAKYFSSFFAFINSSIFYFKNNIFTSQTDVIKSQFKVHKNGVLINLDKNKEDSVNAGMANILAQAYRYKEMTITPFENLEKALKDKNITNDEDPIKIVKEEITKNIKDKLSKLIPENANYKDLDKKINNFCKQWKKTKDEKKLTDLKANFVNDCKKIIMGMIEKNDAIYPFGEIVYNRLKNYNLDLPEFYIPEDKKDADNQK